MMAVDVPFEITLEDLENRLNFVRCYSDVLPKRDPVFDWNYWRLYYLDKLNQKNPSSSPLDGYGRRIANNTKPDYLSHYFLKVLAYATA